MRCWGGVVVGGLADSWRVDYKELAKMEGLPPQDRKVVQRALATLPKRLEEAKQAEMGEMMGKLKEVWGSQFSRRDGVC